MQLKNYQTYALEVLQDYLEKARYSGALQSYNLVQAAAYGQGNTYPAYKPLEWLEAVPYVCLRLPTGGGKTLLTAYTIKLAAEAYLEREYPLTLWMVPTDIIKTQTLETLLNPDNPNHKALNQAFGGRFRVFDVDDYMNIRPQDIRDTACVVVSTFASFRVKDTDIRKVYAHHEELEGHFSQIPPTAKGLETREDGKVRYSFANLLHWHRPLVVVDEAHNAGTDLQFDVLQRLNPACVVEFTATPADNSNVICSVSAAQLKAEEMIKLPIRLFEHADWKAAITASLGTRNRLAELALKDKDYIRPIILFQAQNKGQEVTVEVVKEYLVQVENIPEKEIVVATGDQHGLNGINLFASDCPVKYIITVQALREGWDCSFAYVLCSLANVQSRTAVEQLLGRVLRMPYARLRSHPELNMAYTHVSSTSWPQAATNLRDKLVQMGFQKQEAEEVIIPTPTLDLGGGQVEANFQAHLTHEPNLAKLDIAHQGFVKVEKVASGYVLKVEGRVDSKLLQSLPSVAANRADKDELTLKATIQSKQLEENQTPSQRGVVFSLPQLCFNLDGDIELAEKETCLAHVNWNVADYYTPLLPNEFVVVDKTIKFQIDIDDKREIVTVEYLEEQGQQRFGGVDDGWTESTLVQWLDRRLRQPDIKPEHMLEYLRRMVRDLLSRSDLDISKLVVGKFALEKVLSLKIKEAREAAAKKGFQGLLNLGLVVTQPDFNMVFNPTQYPANRLYSGGYKFRKHYYPLVGDMNKEEAECAWALDCNPLVEYWVRNLELQPKHCFWLQTSTDRFYPDFVTKLKDGRTLVVEYKGEQFKGTPDVEEKIQIGEVWAKSSGNLFLMAWAENKGNIHAQFERVLA